MNQLEHKGYFGNVEHDFEQNTLHGIVLGIRDVVTYEAKNLKSLAGVPQVGRRLFGILRREGRSRPPLLGPVQCSTVAGVAPPSRIDG